MIFNQSTRLAVVFVVTQLISTHVLASEESVTIFGNVRGGLIAVENELENESTQRLYSTAIAGSVGIETDILHNISGRAALFTTQELTNNELTDYFGSDGKGYSLLGEALLQLNINNTKVKVGRFNFDSPHLDTDDIRMVHNTFSGLALTNTDIKDTEIVFAHIDKWAGFDSDQPQKFTRINKSKGINVAGVTYQGIANTTVQSWGYFGEDLLTLLYVEATYEGENYALGAQFGRQLDKTYDKSGAGGDVAGVTASYNMKDFIVNAAFNKVSGIVINGFGGGPYFTSSEDHTIEGVKDQEAVAVGVEYIGINDLTLGVSNVNFEHGADETDYTLDWEVSSAITIRITYHDMHQDGNMLNAVANLNF